MVHKILVVDDEKDILEFLKYNLEAKNYIIETAQDGMSALRKLKTFKPSLIILDVMMPRLNGVETCEKIREDSTLNDVIILFLSARNEEFTQVACYDAGADDFIEKPIKIKLIIKKIEILLKKNIHNNSVTSFNGVILNDKNYTVTSDGETYSLTKKQFNLLELLMSKPDNVFKREKIMQSIWLDTYVSGRNLDVQIRKIREKIGNNKIKTIKGVGYLFTNK
jgi:two-component system alkaline phosphatase synthesis response regulator PhoP